MAFAIWIKFSIDRNTIVFAMCIQRVVEMQKGNALLLWSSVFCSWKMRNKYYKAENNLAAAQPLRCISHLAYSLTKWTSFHYKNKK